MRQYLLAVHMIEGEPAPPEEQIQQAYKAVDAFNAELQSAGVWVFAGGLHPPETATVVRSQNGQVVTTDGPFAETKEQLGGFWVIESPDLDAALARVFGDIDIAEEAVQEAFAVAAQRWPAAGVPPNPGGWIVTTARNKALDRLRRESSRPGREGQAALLHAEAPEVGPVPDDR